MGIIRGIRRAALVSAAASGVLLPACGRDLEFTVDTSIDIVAPAERSMVAQPLEVRWTDERGSLGPGERYGVFVDRAPIRPGQSIESLAGDDALCEPGAACPDDTYLAGLGVHLTTERRVVLDDLPDLRTSGRSSEADRHEVTIVRIHDGRRTGESAFNVTFQVERR